MSCIFSTRKYQSKTVHFVLFMLEKCDSVEDVAQKVFMLTNSFKCVNFPKFWGNKVFNFTKMASKMVLSIKIWRIIRNASFWKSSWHKNDKLIFVLSTITRLFDLCFYYNLLQTASYLDNWLKMILLKRVLPYYFDDVRKKNHVPFTISKPLIYFTLLKLLITKKSL